MIAHENVRPALPMPIKATPYRHQIEASILSAAYLACCREVIGMAQATVKCHLCGRSFQKPQHEISEHNFCCFAHFQQWNRKRLAEYNRTENPANKPGGLLSSRKNTMRSSLALAKENHTANFTASTSIEPLQKP